MRNGKKMSDQSRISILRYSIKTTTSLATKIVLEQELERLLKETE